tara:strand:+ start:398 stop:703 length:306 start_codon:yes stop_codon:yes gene_type:complete
MVSNQRSVQTASCLERSAETSITVLRAIEHYLPVFLALPIFKAHTSMILYSFPIHLSSLGVGVIAAIADAINTIALIIKPIVINITFSYLIVFFYFKLFKP